MFTDKQAAELLLHELGGQVIYCFENSKYNTDNFYRWNGDYWQKIAVERLYKQVTDIFERVAGAFPDDQKKQNEYLRYCNTRPLSSAFVQFAHLPGIMARGDLFNAQKDILNFANCAVDISDLSQPKVIPHNPRHYFTYCMNGEYDPAHKISDNSPLMHYIKTSIPESERVYFQSVLGYCLLADNPEQVFFICHGPGGSGKSLIFERLLSLTGESGYSMQAEELLASKYANDSGHAANPNLVNLRGKRFCKLSEIKAGRKADWNKVKYLTGGDKLTARGLYRDNVSFEVNAKFVMICNDLPGITDSLDNAVRRRLLFIVIPNEIKNRDIHLGEKLSTPESMKDLATYCMDGLKLYAEHGLHETELAAKAKAAYYKNNDHVGEWVDGWLASQNADTIKFQDRTKMFADFKEKYIDISLCKSSTAFYAQVRNRLAARNVKYREKTVQGRRGFEVLELETDLNRFLES